MMWTTSHTPQSSLNCRPITPFTIYICGVCMQGCLYGTPNRDTQFCLRPQTWTHSLATTITINTTHSTRSFNYCFAPLLLYLDSGSWLLLLFRLPLLLMYNYVLDRYHQHTCTCDLNMEIDMASITIYKSRLSGRLHGNMLKLELFGSNSIQVWPNAFHPGHRCGDWLAIEHKDSYM